MPRDYYPGDERRDSRERRRVSEYDRPGYDEYEQARYRRENEEVRLREKTKYSRDMPVPKAHREMGLGRERDPREMMRGDPSREYRGPPVPPMPPRPEYPPEFYDEDPRARRDAKKHKHKKGKKKRKHSKDRELDRGRGLVDYECISSDPDSEAFAHSPAVIDPAHARAAARGASPSAANFRKRLTDRSHSNSPALHRDSRHVSPSARSRASYAGVRPASPPPVDTHRRGEREVAGSAPRAYRGTSPTRPPSPKRPRHNRSPSPYTARKKPSPTR